MRSRPSPADPAFVDRGAENLLLHLHVVPGARTTELGGLHGDRIKVRVNARAAAGAANRELLRFLADLLDLPPSALEIVRGLADRRKTVRLPAGSNIAPLLAALQD